MGGPRQGYSVSLSADGRTAIVGGLLDNGSTGAAWIFAAPDPADFDGDSTSDRTVFQPSNGAWYSVSSVGGATITGWGASTDLDVAGDYDGDGKVDIAIWRPSIGMWFIV